MTTANHVHVRCPCCGEVFALTSDLVVLDPPAAAAPVPAPAARPVAAPAAQPAPAASGVPITLIFDGGSRGNPGQGYGSFSFTVEGRPEEPRRLDFGDGYTNNEAEYDTLIAALEELLLRIANPQLVRLDIRGDSQLVIKQITGAWKIKEPRMLARARRVHELLAQLGSWTATWHERGNSVAALGH